MRHVYECPTRWADLDLFGHVNNVVWADYLQEARIDLMHGLLPRRDPGEGIVVVRHTLAYRRSLGLRFRPVTVETWVAEVRSASFTLGYEVFHTREDGEREVYLRASSVLAPFRLDSGRPRRITPEEQEVLRTRADDGPLPVAVRPGTPSAERASRAAVPVRFSDLDVYRHVNNVTYLEYFQEARLRMFAGLARDHGTEVPDIVVAQADVVYVRPVLLRPEPYTCLSEVVAVGRTSLTVDAEILDEGDGGAAGRTSLARARVALVCVDRATGRPTAVPERLAAHVAARG